MPLVVLRALEGIKALTIWVRIADTNALGLAIEHVTTPRPWNNDRLNKTHDLSRTVSGVIRATVTRVVVSALRDSTFSATRSLTLPGYECHIDSRRSDATARGLSVQAPIYVTRAVIKRAGCMDVGAQNA